MHKNIHDGDTCTVIKDGFKGMLFRSVARVHPQTAVLIVGGGEGGLHTALTVAESFASRAIDTDMDKQHMSNTIDDNKHFWQKTAKIYSLFTRGSRAGNKTYAEIESCIQQQLTKKNAGA
jgi:hypothetical protein